MKPVIQVMLLLLFLLQHLSVKAAPSAGTSTKGSVTTLVSHGQAVTASSSKSSSKAATRNPVNPTTTMKRSSNAVSGTPAKPSGPVKSTSNAVTGTQTGPTQSASKTVSGKISKPTGSRGHTSSSPQNTNKPNGNNGTGAMTQHISMLLMIQIVALYQCL